VSGGGFSFGVVIGERVTTQLGGLDHAQHDLLVMEMLGLAEDPLKKGQDLPGSPGQRMLGIGSAAAILYQVDAEARVVYVQELWVL